MRRIVILFLLFLLPIEVFAGISYEQHLAQDAQYEAYQSGASAAAAQAPLAPAALDLDLDVDSGFTLDLGEAFDVPCKSFKKAAPCVASPPIHVTYCDKSIVVDVPLRPAIQLT